MIKIINILLIITFMTSYAFPAELHTKFAVIHYALSPLSAYKVQAITSQILNSQQLRNFLRENRNGNEIPYKIVEFYKEISRDIEKEIVAKKHPIKQNKISKTKNNIFKFTLASIIIYSLNLYFKGITSFFSTIFNETITFSQENPLATTIIISIISLTTSDLIAQSISKIKKSANRTLVVVISALLSNVYYHVWFNQGVPYILDHTIFALSTTLIALTILDIFFVGGLGYTIIFMLIKARLNDDLNMKTFKKISDEVFFLQKNQPGVRHSISKIFSKFKVTEKFADAIKNANPKFVVFFQNIFISIRNLICFYLDKNKSTQQFSSYLRTQNRLGGVTYRSNLAIWSIPIIMIYASLSSNLWVVMPIVMMVDLVWGIILSYRSATNNSQIVSDISDKINKDIDNTIDMIIETEEDILVMINYELQKTKLRNRELNYVVSAILYNSLKHFRTTRTHSFNINEFKKGLEDKLEFLKAKFHGIYDEARVIVTTKNINSLRVQDNTKCIIRIPQTDQNHINRYIDKIIKNLFLKNSPLAEFHHNSLKTLMMTVINNKGLTESNDFYLEHGYTLGSKFKQYHIKIKGVWPVSYKNKIIKVMTDLGFKNTTNIKQNSFDILEVYSHNGSVTQPHVPVVAIKFEVNAPPVVHDHSGIDIAA